MPVNQERLSKALDNFPLYKQGSGRLEASNEGEVYNCCLGVLSREAIKQGCNVKVIEDKNNDITRFDNSEWFLPESVQLFYGFDDDNPKLNFNGEYISATVLNDSGEYHDEKVILPQTLSTIEQLFRDTYLEEDSNE